MNVLKLSDNRDSIIEIAVDVVSATTPSNPYEGMVWYDTTNNMMKMYAGGAWQSRISNSDMVDGYHASTTPTATTVPVSDGTGKLNIGWIPSGVDAGKLQSRNVATTAPSNGQALAWNATSSQWEPQTISGGGGGFNKLVKTTDTSNSTTTAVNVSELTFAMSANTSYMFHFYLICDSAATTAGIQLGLNGPASPTLVMATIVGWTSATAIATTGITAYETYQANTASAGTTKRLFEIYGIIQNGANAGDFYIRLKSEVAGSAVYVRAGSWGWWTTP